MDTETTGPEITGTQTTGTETIGPATIGTETNGTETNGTETEASEADSARRRTQGAVPVQAAHDTVAEPVEAGTAVAEPVEAGGTGGATALERRLEAILMVADEPQGVVGLATALAVPVRAVHQAIDALVADFDGVDSTIRRGFELREVGGGWRIYVRPEHDAAVADFVLTQNPTRLSQAALETLAVIAYKQPVSRGAVASIRAVNVDSVVRTLLGRGLITEAYTDNETGAIHYATTELTLTQLGINSIDELPQLSPLLTDGSDGFDDVF